MKALPADPTAPARPELPPGDRAELKPLLEQLRKSLVSKEPLPCKEILAALLQKKWPAEQETILWELNRLVNLYRLPQSLEVLNK